MSLSQQNHLIQSATGGNQHDFAVSVGKVLSGSNLVIDWPYKQSEEVFLRSGENQILMRFMYRRSDLGTRSCAAGHLKRVTVKRWDPWPQSLVEIVGREMRDENQSRLCDMLGSRSILEQGSYPLRFGVFIGATEGLGQRHERVEVQRHVGHAAGSGALRYRLSAGTRFEVLHYRGPAQRTYVTQPSNCHNHVAED